MKKIQIALVVALAFTLIATPVFAGKWVDAQKAPFYNVSCSSNNVDGTITAGEINIVDPMGNVSLVIQAKVRGLTPNSGYDFWVRDFTGYTGTFLYKAVGSDYTYFKLLTFMTDEYGNADVHLNLRADDLPDGTYEIQVAINEYNNIYCTEIATQWPGLTVTVKSQ